MKLGQSVKGKRYIIWPYHMPHHVAKAIVNPSIKLYFRNQSKILFISGLVSEHEGDYESAMKMFVQSLSINSENCDVLIQLAKLYIRLGQFTQAEKCIRDAISKLQNICKFYFNDDFRTLR